MRTFEQNQKYKENKIINILFQVLAYILLCYMVLRHVDILNIPYVVPDEFGYWSAASYFCGYDWSSASTLNPYYAFGYGILLAPILKLFHGVYVYKAAIFLNALMLCCMFYILKRICDIIWGKSLLNTIISMGSCLYTFNIVYAQLALCEIFLEIVFLFSVLWLLRLLEYGTWVNCIGYAISLSFLYWIHMRSLGLLITGCLFILILWKEKKITKWNLLIFFTVMTAMVSISVVIKSNMSQYLYSESVLSSVNDYSGQVGKLRALITLDGIIDLLVEVAGQLWYLGSSTFLLFFFAIMSIGKDIIVKFKQKKLMEPYGLYEIYLLLGFFMTLGISSVAAKSSRRTDTLIYGRYVEFVILPLLVLGIYGIVYKKFKNREILLSTVIYLFFSIVVDFTYKTKDYSGIVYTTVVGIYKFLWQHYDYFVPHVTLFTILIETIIILFCLGKKKIINAIMVLSISCIIWNVHTNGFVNDGILMHQNSIEAVKIAGIIEERKHEYPVYYVYDTNDSTYIMNRVFMLQFLLKDIKINCFSWEHLDSIEEKKYYIIANKNSKCIKEIEYQYIQLEEGNPFVLYYVNNSD